MQKQKLKIHYGIISNNALFPRRNRPHGLIRVNYARLPNQKPYVLTDEWYRMDEKKQYYFYEYIITVQRHLFRIQRSRRRTVAAVVVVNTSLSATE